MSSKVAVRESLESAGPASTRWDRMADVVVVGFGAAGAAVAIEAADHGAEVLILERAERGGGTTRMSGGGFSAPKSAERVEETATYLLECARGLVAEDVVRAWCLEALTTPQWARDVLGAEVVQQVSHPPGYRGGYHHSFRGCEDIVSWRFPKGGAEMFERLEMAVERRHVEVLYGIRGRELVRDSSGAVVGLRAERGGRPFAVGARRAVVLACGGFGFDEELKRQFLRAYPCYSTGAPTCTGDGIRMGQAAGGALCKMTAMSGALVYKPPGYEVACTSLLQADAAHRAGIIVNRDGHRFANEELTYDSFNLALGDFDPARNRYVNVPAYTVFDDRGRKQGPVAHAFRENITSVIGYTWSRDCLEEVENGWVKRDYTLAGLAKVCGINYIGLAETVKRFNAFCETGKDADYGRSHCLLPLDTPPYYAIEAWPGFWDTCGGLKINTNSQVVSAINRPIPRLYAAGTTANGTVGFFYPLRGHCIGDALAFGRIAGRNAAAEKPWF